MSDLFAAFGLDWRLLLINSVNFGATLFLLWYFLYGPLTTVLEERRKKVAQGVRDAEESAHQLKQITESRSEVLAQAGKEADTMLTHARARAAAKEHELIAAGEAVAAKLVAEADAQARELKAQALAESKQEVAKLIVLGMEKLAQSK